MKKVDQTYLFNIYFLFVQIGMILLKLTGVFEISWFWVFFPVYIVLIPLFLYITFIFLYITVAFIITVIELLRN